MAKSASSCSSLNEGQPKTTKMRYIIDIMIANGDLLEHWQRFSDELESPAGKKLLWQTRPKEGDYYYVVIKEIIQDWISRTGTKTVKDLCTVLGILGFIRLSETLEEKVGEDCIIQPESTEGGTNSNQFVESGKKIKYPITHGLLINAGNFSGREKELEQLKNYFKSEEKLVLVYGFGGIGKTELCKKFANDLTNNSVKGDKSDISLIWLEGETRETLDKSVLEVAEYLGIKNDGNPSTLEYFEYLVRVILEKSDRLLVVIDNVDDIYDEVEELVIKSTQKANNSKMTVIVTSRYSEVLGYGKPTVFVDELSTPDVRTMLKKSVPCLSKSDADEINNADELGKLVQNFPLALQQAVAFIKQQRADFNTRNYSVQNYVEEFEQKKELMLGKKLGKYDYEKTTLIVWNVTLDKIKLQCEDAEGILKIVAHLDPENIELDFLALICRRRKLDFGKGFNIIYKYCIVKLSPWSFNRERCSIHRLLQDVLRGENNNNEYSRALFDDVFFVSVERKVYGKSWSVIDDLESLQLKSLCKYANLKWVNDSFFHFHGAILILLELNRPDCALECIKVKYPQLVESNTTELSEEMKVEFVEKFVLWCVINGRGYNVTKDIVMNGEYDAHWDHYDSTRVNSIEQALKISIKYFGENSKHHFVVINKLIRKLYNHDIDIEKAMKLCEGFGNFQFDREMKLIYFDTICYILLALDYERAVEIQQIERVEKIITHFSELHPKSVELVGLLEAIIFDFKEDYVKAQDLIRQFLPQFEENHRVLIWWFERKELELKIKTIDFDVLTREEIERELGEIYYIPIYEYINTNEISLRNLEKIEKLFEEKLGEVDSITVKLKNIVSRKIMGY